jgi:rhodanese-related sulfurtransferase
LKHDLARLSFTATAILLFLPILPNAGFGSASGFLSFVDVFRSGPQTHWTIVDVRDKGSFEIFRIPGSLNVALPFVRAHPELKSSRVLLVGEGYDAGALTRALAQLAGEGFSTVYALRGGIAAWVRSGGAIEGNARAARGCLAIPAWAAADLVKEPGWKLLHVDGNESAAKVLKRIASQSEAGSDGIILVGDDMVRLDRIADAAVKKGFSATLIVSGGAGAWAVYQREKARGKRRVNPARKVAAACGY